MPMKFEFVCVFVCVVFVSPAQPPLHYRILVCSGCSLHIMAKEKVTTANIWVWWVKSPKTLMPRYFANITTFSICRSCDELWVPILYRFHDRTDHKFHRNCSLVIGFMAFSHLLVKCHWHALSALHQPIWHSTRSERVLTQLWVWQIQCAICGARAILDTYWLSFKLLISFFVVTVKKSLTNWRFLPGVRRTTSFQIILLDRAHNIFAYRSVSGNGIDIFYLNHSPFLLRLCSPRTELKQTSSKWKLNEVRWMMDKEEEKDAVTRINVVVVVVFIA